jgi:TatD DNase family protein
MPGLLIDTHCHLDSEGFHQDIDSVIQRALDSGVERMLTIGVTLETSQAAVLLSNRYPCVSAVVGIQPNYAHEAKPTDWEKIEDLATHPNVVGVGETGLDKYWDFAPIDIQRDFFVRHIELSRRLKLPFVVHCREAEAEVIEVLQTEAANGTLSGVMHSFSGSAATAAECVRLGMHISFAGMLTFRKNEDLRSAARSVPLDRLLVETDAPYLAPLPHRGKRNEPAWVRFTSDCLAQVHGVSPEQMAEQTTLNAKQLFRIR